jgi:FMN phosphatase YigB (HAD superfamily)
VTAPRRYRALSVDLWFTMLFYEAGDEERWRRARLRVLRDLVRTPAGRPYSESELSEALRATRRQGTALVRSPDAREPGEVVEAVAKRLGGRLTASREVGARRYSDAGLDETPPKLNPEVVRLAAGLRPLPMVVISNTGRRGSTWATVLELLGGPRFEAIVTSCEIGRGKPDRAIFDEASRRLGIPSREILHVGDRWDLDVEGALGAGFGAVGAYQVIGLALVARTLHMGAPENLVTPFVQQFGFVAANAASTALAAYGATHGQLGVCLGAAVLYQTVYGVLGLLFALQVYTLPVWTALAVAVALAMLAYAVVLSLPRAAARLKS